MELFLVTTNEIKGTLPLVQAQVENKIVKAYSTVKDAFNAVPLSKNAVYYCYSIDTTQLIKKHIITPTEMYACHDNILALDTNEWGLSGVVIYNDLNMYVLRDWKKKEIETYSFDDILNIDIDKMSQPTATILSDIELEPLVEQFIEINTNQQLLELCGK